MSSVSTNVHGARSSGSGMRAQTPRKGFSAPVVATTLFVFTEIMFFLALVSAYVILEARTGAWQPPVDVRMPVMVTGLNTAVLLLSAFFLFTCAKRFAEHDRDTAGRDLLISGGLATLFVGIQMFEWTKLIEAGMGIQSGIFGAAFYLVVGSHAVHVASAVPLFVALYRWWQKDTLKLEHIYAMQIFWFVVVGVWPGLYWLVYF